MSQRAETSLYFPLKHLTDQVTLYCYSGFTMPRKPTLTLSVWSFAQTNKIISRVEENKTDVFRGAIIITDFSISISEICFENQVPPISKCCNSNGHLLSLTYR